MNRLILAILMGLTAGPVLAQTAPETLLNQAMLLGPARIEDAGTQLTLFGEAGTQSYMATASGPACTSTGTACTTIEFQALAPPAGAEALATWQAEAHEGTVTQGPDGWMVLTLQAQLPADPAQTFQDWGALAAAFHQRFGG